MTEESKVYIDTSILANWMLLYRKGKRTQRKAENRAKECMRLLDEIRQHKYQCEFITSTYAFAEIGQSARDARIAIKMIRDGISLHWFNRLKKYYPLKRKEQTSIMQSIESFYSFLENLGINIVEPVIDQTDINMISLRYSLEVSDATHIVIGKLSKSNYLLTVDHDFTESKPKIRTPQPLRPSTLATMKSLRK